MRYNVLMIALCSLTTLASQNRGIRTAIIANHTPNVDFLIFFNNRYNVQQSLAIPSGQESSIETPDDHFFLNWAKGHLQEKIYIPGNDKITIVSAFAIKQASLPNNIMHRISNIETP